MPPVSLRRFVKEVRFHAPQLLSAACLLVIAGCATTPTERSSTAGPSGIPSSSNSSSGPLLPTPTDINPMTPSGSPLATANAAAKYQSLAKLYLDAVDQFATAQALGCTGPDASLRTCQGGVTAFSQAVDNFAGALIATPWPLAARGDAQALAQALTTYDKALLAAGNANTPSDVADAVANANSSNGARVGGALSAFQGDLSLPTASLAATSPSPR